MARLPAGGQHTPTRAEQRRARAGLKLARALEKAADAMDDFASACWDCGERSLKQIDGRPDQRETLSRDMREYSNFMYGRYDRD